MANPWEYLRDWTKEHVNATAYEDEGTAKALAAECLRDAKKAGFSEAAIIKAAGGNLETHMLNALNSQVDREVERLAAKDK